MNRALTMALVALVALAVVGRASAQSESYVGGVGVVGLARVTDWHVLADLDDGTATVIGEVANVSDVTLLGVTVTVWDNEFVDVQTVPPNLAPGEVGQFTAVIGAGPNWAWQIHVTASPARLVLSPTLTR